MVKVESLPEGERAAATSMYANVDMLAAADIEKIVTEKLATVTAQLPSSTLPHLVAEFRNSWLRDEYCRIVSRVLKARCHTPTVDEKTWTFKPAMSVETLPSAEQERARTLFAAVTRETAEEIQRATEDKWLPYRANFPIILPEECVAELKKTWLKVEYMHIVSSIVTSSAIPSASSNIATSPSASPLTVKSRTRPLEEVASAKTIQHEQLHKKISVVVSIHLHKFASTSALK